jgi:hypothetical protein
MGFAKDMKVGSLFSGSKTVRHANERRINMTDDVKSSEELINFLESKLEQHEKNLKQRQSEYEALQAEYYDL